MEVNRAIREAALASAPLFLLQHRRSCLSPLVPSLSEPRIGRKRPAVNHLKGQGNRVAQPIYC